MYQKLPGISYRFRAEGLGGDLQRGLRQSGFGKCILIPSAPWARMCPQQWSFQVMVGTDGSARGTGMQTCKDGSCRQPAPVTLLGLIRGCSAKGQEAGRKTIPQAQEISPGSLNRWDQTRVNLSFSLLSWGLKYVDGWLSRSQLMWQIRVNALLLPWGGTEIPQTWWGLGRPSRKS